MKIKVLGSGGCVALPLPTCQCEVCNEARNKGVPYSRSGCSIFIEDIKTIIDAPCDIKPFPKDEETFYNAECMILGNVIPDEPLKNGYFIPEDNILKQTLFTMEEVIEIKNKYNIKEVIITHIEEDWGKSYSDYIKLEEKYRDQNIKFAYDGMEINL